MATLTVWRFDDASGAESAVATVEELQRQELIQLHDAATVTWEAGRRKPRTRHLADMTGRGALGGAFWGFLFGLIFFIPLLGLAVGAAAGALGGSLANAGIDKDFIERVRAEVRPGTSALFLLTSGAVADRVRDAFQGSHAQLVSTNLSESDERALREAFAEEG